jgi:hypothetical protein
MSAPSLLARELPAQFRGLRTEPPISQVAEDLVEAIASDDVQSAREAHTAIDRGLKTGRERPSGILAREMLREILLDLFPLALVLAVLLNAAGRAPRLSAASTWNRQSAVGTASRRSPPLVALQPEGARAVALPPARKEARDGQP